MVVNLCALWAVINYARPVLDESIADLEGELSNPGDDPVLKALTSLSSSLGAARDALEDETTGDPDNRQMAYPTVS